MRFWKKSLSNLTKSLTHRLGDWGAQKKLFEILFIYLLRDDFGIKIEMWNMKLNDPA